jgi:hypothetical protein
VTKEGVKDATYKGFPGFFVSRVPSSLPEIKPLFAFYLQLLLRLVTLFVRANDRGCYLVPF